MCLPVEMGGGGLEGTDAKELGQDTWRGALFIQGKVGSFHPL